MTKPAGNIKSKFTIYLFIIICLSVAAFIFIKLQDTNKQDLYVKIKLSQGYWWSATSKPNYWIPSSINVGNYETDTGGAKSAEIIETRYYPFIEYQDENTIRAETQYNAYVVAKIKATYNKSQGKYYYKRDSLTIASPIAIETTNTLINGTIMQISESEIQNNDKNIKVLLSKPTSNVGTYAVRGEKYFDGTEDVLEIVNSYFSKGKHYLLLTMKVTDTPEGYFYGDTRIMKTGDAISLYTNKSLIKSYLIEAIY